MGKTSRPHPLLLALFCLVMLLGAGLRLQRYLLRSPFWRDEAFIVVNVRDLPAQRMLGPLQYDQAAPPGFLLAEHLMARVAGTGEYALRAVPLACGLAAMGIVAGLAWKLFGIEAAIFAGGLMAFCQKLIEYSAEVKQYSGDVCAAAILLLVATGTEGSAIRRLWQSALAATILVWFSHPTVLMFGGISVVLSIVALGEAVGWGGRAALADGAAGRGEQARRLTGKMGVLAGIVVANVLFAGSFLVLYYLSIRHEHTDFLYSFWGDSFPDWRHPAGLAGWLFRQTSQWLNEPYHGAGWVLVALAIIALPMLLAQRRGSFWLMSALPLGFVLIAACLRQYPYGGSRLTLFTLPGFFLLSATGVELIRRRIDQRWVPAWRLAPGAILAYGLGWGVIHAARPHYHSYLRPAIAYLRQHRSADEPIYCLGEPDADKPGSIFVGRHVEILCYWPAPPGKVETVVRSADQLRGDRYWILLPFTTPDGQRGLNSALKQLDGWGKRVDTFVDARGGAAMLYQRR